MALKIADAVLGFLLGISDKNHAKVMPEVDARVNPNYVGAVKLMTEKDAGKASAGGNSLVPIKADDYFRLKVSQDVLLDSETFNYTAQNTGKHIYRNTTMTAVWNAGFWLTNNGNITNATSGVSLQTYAYFPLFGASVLYAEFKAGFSAAPTANTVIDFGFFIPNTANPYNPTDGVYFSLTSAGLNAVLMYNGTATSVPITFNYTANTKYQFSIIISEQNVDFFINNDRYAVIPTQAANGQPFMATALPLSVRHSIVGGAAGSAISFQLCDYTVSINGTQMSDDLGSINNRILGSYQGLSGGTMGSLANYVNNTNPAAAVPTNTTAALGTGLGGQFWETDTLAVTTDGIISSYQNPAGTVNIVGKRLKITGVKIDSYVQAAITGGGYNAQFALCFGHTNVSLATAEGASTKAPRRIALGSYSVASGAVALTQLPTIQYTFQNPIYVNPSEFVAIVKKKVGTAPSTGTIAYTILFDYSFE